MLVGGADQPPLVAAASFSTNNSATSAPNTVRVFSIIRSAVD
jgi:hypothetical protein